MTSFRDKQQNRLKPRDGGDTPISNKKKDSRSVRQTPLTSGVESQIIRWLGPIEEKIILEGQNNLRISNCRQEKM